MKALKLFIIHGLSLLLLMSCNPLGESRIKVNLARQKLDLGAQVKSVTLNNDQLTITGGGFSSASDLQLKGNGVTSNLSIISQTDSTIVAKIMSNVSILVNGAFDLIISNAQAQSVINVTFTLQDGAVRASHLSSMGATSGQVLKYNGTNWAPDSLPNSQVYLGTWNATTNVPDISYLSSFQAGDYYIVGTPGTFGSLTYAAGDWVMFNGAAWEKIDNTTNIVSSFQTRKGPVVLLPSDYVSLIDTTTLKLTGSKLADIADIDVLTNPPTNGQVLKWDTTTSKWLPANVPTSSGIALSDLSATSPLSYNSSSGVFSLPSANILALPLTGLAAGSGALSATDTILAGFGKLMSLPSDYVSKSANTTMSTGTLALSGVAMITVPTATGTTLSEVANVTYVNNAIGANGVWTKNNSDIGYTTGKVGIGTTTPAFKLTISDLTPAAVTSTVVYSDTSNIALNTYSATHATANIAGTSSVSSSGTLDLRTAATSNTIRFYLGGQSSFGYQHALIKTDTLVIGSRDGSLSSIHSGTISAPSAAAAGATNIAGGSLHLSGGRGTGSAAGGSIVFNTSNADVAGEVLNPLFERMRITSTGNVGIGTTAPTNKFEVVGDSKINNLFFYNNGSATEINTLDGGNIILGGRRMADLDPNTNIAAIRIRPNLTGAGVSIGVPESETIEAPLHIKSAGSASISTALLIGASGNSGTGRGQAIVIRQPNGTGIGRDAVKISGVDDGLTLSTGAGTLIDRFRIDSLGNVGIGTPSPSYNLHVVGTAGLSSGTAWINASDIRLKDIHGDYNYGLDEILQLHTVRYSYKKNNPLKLPSDFTKTGFIAQEVQKVIPEAVTKRKDGYLELNVDPIHWAVVNAIKDLYTKYITPLWENDKIQASKIAALESDVHMLKEEIRRMQKEAKK